MKIINTANAGEIKIFTDDYEPDIPEMVSKIGNSDFSKGQKIRIMPDTHVGKGCMIGFTSTIGHCINPDFIGCDIGCTVSSTVFKDYHIDRKYFSVIEKNIRNFIPTGFHRFGEKETDFYTRNSQPVMSFEEFEGYLYNIVLRKKTLIEKAEKKTGNVYMQDTVDINQPGWLAEWGKKFGLLKVDIIDTICTVGCGNHFIEIDENEKNSALTVHVS